MSEYVNAPVFRIGTMSIPMDAQQDTPIQVTLARVGGFAGDPFPERIVLEGVDYDWAWHAFGCGKNFTLWPVDRQDSAIEDAMLKMNRVDLGIDETEQKDSENA